MPIFSNKSRTKRPSWAADLTPEGYDVFRAALLKVSQGELDSDAADADGRLDVNGTQLNVSNFTGACSLLESDKWEEDIKRRLEVLIIGEENFEVEYPRDTDKVCLQLYPVGLFDPPHMEIDAAVYREDIPGLLATVAMVIGENMVTTIADQGERGWAKNRDEIIDGLKAKLAAGKPYAADFIKLPKHKDVMLAVIAGDFFTATHALVLEDLYPQLIGSHGAVVAMPLSQVLIVKRLDEEPTKKLIDAVDQVSHDYLDEHRDWVTEHVYRYQDGAFSLLR